MTNTAVCTSKRFRHDRGYGFLTDAENRSIFLHRDVLVSGGFQPPLPGATVHVEYEQGDRGLRATRIISIEGGTDEGAPEDLGDPEPGRVKFYDWTKGFGFAHGFGYPDTDLFFAAGMIEGFGEPPQNGEAVAIYRDPSEVNKLAKVIPWSMVEFREVV